MRGTLYVNNSHEIGFLLGRWQLPSAGVTILSHVNLSDSELGKIKQMGCLRVYFITQNNVYTLISTHAPHSSELVANIAITDIGGIAL